MPEKQRDRSIRNIPVPVSHRRVNPTPSRQPEDYSDYQNDEAGVPPPRRPKLPRRRRHMWWWLGGVILMCALGGLLVSTVFEGAVITVTPREFTPTVPQTLVAQQNASSGTFGYQLVIASQSATTTAQANGTQQVSLPATGQVTLYNSYSTAPQSLVAGTRLSTPDGKIYRIQKAVSIPGYTNKADGSTAPGTLSVSVTADKPGSAYNQTGVVQLTIPGFKGAPQYSKIVGQSVGAISGGFIGAEPAVSPSDMSNAENTLKQQLDANIRSAVTTQIPTGFFAVNGSLAVQYSDVAQNANSSSTVALSEKATASVAIVRTTDLTTALAKQVVKDYAGEPVAFADASKVDLSLSTTAASTTSNGPLSIVVGGSPVLVWQVDVAALKQALLGKPKSTFPDIVKSFEPALAKAEASIRPFWKATFPTDQARLKIVVTQ